MELLRKSGFPEDSIKIVLIHLEYAAKLHAAELKKIEELKEKDRQAHQKEIERGVFFII